AKAGGTGAPQRSTTGAGLAGARCGGRLMTRAVHRLRRTRARPEEDPAPALRATNGRVPRQSGTSHLGTRGAAPGHRQEDGGPMPPDYRIFSLRMLHALAARLERAKTGFGHGELSTGEVARRLLEQRLDQLAQQEAHGQARHTLWEMVAKWRAALGWT